jgi:hypothetical protein
VQQRSHWAALASVCVLSVPAAASAQLTTGELRRYQTDHRVAGELGFFYRQEGAADLAMFQPSLFGNFTVHRFDDTHGFVQVDAAWRFAGLFGDFSAFRAGNPFFGIRAGTQQGGPDDQWRARGGIGLTLPLSNLYDDFGGGPGLNHGIFTWAIGPGMQGGYDNWLYTPLNMAVVFRGDFEYRGEAFGVGVDGAVGLMMPVEYRGRTGNTLVQMQIGGFVAGRPIPELALGLRAQTVLLIPTGMGTRAEGLVALVPFVRGEFEGGAFLESRLVMNLDDPYGFSFDSGSIAMGALRVWAVQLNAGADF